MSTLKENDIAVLNYIFDPNITGQCDVHFSIEDSEYTDSENPSSDKEQEVSEIQLRGVRAAEKGDFNEAIRLLTDALGIYQTASLYNNRAQVYRLIGNDTRAMEDLERAVELSEGKGKVACQALCQRGILFRKEGNDQRAKEDFTLAASIGSCFARRQLVEMNPYAAMCNQMLHQMMFLKEEAPKCNLKTKNEQ